MQVANIPRNEQERLNNLYGYELLNTLPEKDYDDITKLASYICDTSISLVTLIDKDRQWFKSAYGTTITQTERDVAFCTHAILKPDEIMVVPNTENDERFVDNPLVAGEPHIMFYAGVPLVTEEGYPIGSLCVIDEKPKELNAYQLQALKILANQTMRLIQLHKKTKDLQRNEQLLQQVNTELEKFAETAAENIKKPCDNAIEFTDLITQKFSDVIDADGKQLLSLITYSCENIKNTIDITLQRANQISLLQDNKTLFTFTRLMQDLKQRVSSGNIAIENYPENDTIYFFKNILLEVLAVIVMASTNDSSSSNVISLNHQQDRQDYIFILTNNNLGIPVFSRNGELSLLPLYNNAENSSYLENLNKAKQLITLLSGSLEIHFEEGKNSRFTVRVPK